MKRLSKISLILVGFIVLTGAAATDPRKQVVLIPSSDVMLRTDPDTTVGQYYTVSYSLPEGLTSADLERAILEVYVDVSAKARGEYVNEAPVLEVFALKGPFRRFLDPDALDPKTRAGRPVVAGAGRRVLIDVTGIVRAHLEGTIENHGLVVGSLLGMREGEFTLLSGRLPQGAVGRLRVYRRHEFVPVEVTSKDAGLSLRSRGSHR
jgi:hypothetical protein